MNPRTIDELTLLAIGQSLSRHAPHLLYLVRNELRKPPTILGGKSLRDFTTSYYSIQMSHEDAKRILDALEAMNEAGVEPIGEGFHPRRLADDFRKCFTPAVA